MRPAMTFTEIMHSYFRGEKLEAVFFIIPLGVALAALAVVALRYERGGFAWGVAVPCVVFSLLLMSVGVTVAARTAGQVAALDQGFATAPAETLAAELPRMHMVQQNFQTYLWIMGALGLLGLGLRFVLSASWAHAAGAVLVLAAGLAFLIDGFAERRARPYVAALEARAQALDAAQGEDATAPAATTPHR
ncbi:MAG: hypothetical protein Tsb0020_39600 [Haliangiales bacterium]